jgi:hypothetical protein
MYHSQNDMDDRQRMMGQQQHQRSQFDSNHSQYDNSHSDKPNSDFQFNPEAMSFLPSPTNSTHPDVQRPPINIDMSPGGSLVGKVNYDVAPPMDQSGYQNSGAGPGGMQQMQGRRQGMNSGPPQGVDPMTMQPMGPGMAPQGNFPQGMAPQGNFPQGQQNMGNMQPMRQQPQQNMGNMPPQNMGNVGPAGQPHAMGPGMAPVNMGVVTPGLSRQPQQNNGQNMAQRPDNQSMVLVNQGNMGGGNMVGGNTPCGNMAMAPANMPNTPTPMMNSMPGQQGQMQVTATLQQRLSELEQEMIQLKKHCQDIDKTKTQKELEARQMEAELLSERDQRKAQLADRDAYIKELKQQATRNAEECISLKRKLEESDSTLSCVSCKFRRLNVNQDMDVEGEMFANAPRPTIQKRDKKFGNLQML